jgi:hypothetical protein
MKHSKNKAGIIVGNGKTRNNFDLNSFKGVATIFGCNALYRDFDGWDYLVAIDDGIIEELQNANLKDRNVVIPDPDRRWESGEYSPYRKRNNAGMVAMEEAIMLEHNILYCIGFDFILEGDISTDNVYKDTKNYGPETHASGADNYNRVTYLNWFANQNKDTQFIFVIPDDVSHKSLDANNIMIMRESVFKKKLNK